MLVAAYPARPVLDCKPRLGARCCDVIAAAVGALQRVVALDILLAATFAATRAAAAALAATFALAEPPV